MSKPCSSDKEHLITGVEASIGEKLRNSPPAGALVEQDLANERSGARLLLTPAGGGAPLPSS
jgi:hypothetical protein